MNNSSIISPPPPPIFWKYTTHLLRLVAKTSLLFNTSGIRAATENPQRIKIAKDGSGSKHNRVRSANSQTKNEYGCAFVDAVSFQGHQFFIICS